MPCRATATMGRNYRGMVKSNGGIVLVKTEYIESTIRRCADIEPEEFKELLNKSLAERDWGVGAVGSGYESGTWKRVACSGRV